MEKLIPGLEMLIPNLGKLFSKSEKLIPALEKSFSGTKPISIATSDIDLSAPAPAMA
ncbi:MAG TPA: hypothetical protein VFE33_09000 [Thermoanaerobaculia bacterium]|nr:hypothetical protein [Thermoanaerobaculia bacterium]